MRVVSGLMFFPRGGSAQVARAVARELPAHGVDVTIVSGSSPGAGDAREFYAGLDVRPVDFEAGDAPMHPSYEDRPGAADRCFALIGDDEYERHVQSWARALAHAGAAGADVLHLHHLTPLNEAATRVAPGVPVVGHLHGTELLMLERIEAGAPARWIYAAQWRERMRRWAAGCERLLVLSRDRIARAAELLGVDPARCAVAPNGFDPRTFRPRAIDRERLWRERLVEDPRGWLPGSKPGSIAYPPQAARRLAESVVLIAVGRYTAVKRLGLLIRAFAGARPQLRSPAALVIVGGHPGEWEGEHPADVIAETGARDVYLAGWRDHSQLADMLNAADVEVLASVREQFGLVLVEGMACGLPAIAVDRLGPAEIVTPATGWLVEPDDEPGLRAAIVAAVNDPEERMRRGVAARERALERWSWPMLAAQLAGTFAEVAGIEQPL